MSTGKSAAGPSSLDDIREAAGALAPYLVRTPVHAWLSRELAERAGRFAGVHLKLELWQHSGTFKARGVMMNLLALSPAQRERGVTAMSAGNHAVAVAWGAAQLGISAKVVMQASANPARLAAARAYGAEILLAQDGPTGFALAESIARDEGRTFIHPFDGALTALGTATLGLEFVEQAPALDAVIIAIGGGGLAGGAARAIKLANPRCEIIGVEPEGADTMHRSFAARSAQRIERVNTIADSLGPPMTLPYPYELCRAHVDQLVKVSDDEMCVALALLFREMKLAVEPAAAAGTAALLYRVADRLAGKQVGLVICGSNIDSVTYTQLLERGTRAL